MSLPSLKRKSAWCSLSFLQQHSATQAQKLTHYLSDMSNPFCLTWLVHVLRLGVGVCCVADWSFVRVWGELVIQLLWAVDENGKTLHLVPGKKILRIVLKKTKQKKTTSILWKWNLCFGLLAGQNYIFCLSLKYHHCFCNIDTNQHELQQLSLFSYVTCTEHFHSLSSRRHWNQSLEST